MLIQGDTGKWEVILGLEVHAQVSSESKLFSASSTAFGAEPNTQVSFIDAALPGTLPALNEKCVEQAVRTGLGLNAKINLCSVFDRKHYFYPDLPQGYQISQFDHPIVGEGLVEVDCEDGSSRQVRITRIHLEQDAGKSMHDQHPSESFIDLNRAGIALMEIVTEPDMRSSQEAGEFMKKLRSILRYLGTCDGDMEKGSLRCDANVSVRRQGEHKFGTRVEIKNLNSIRNLIRAIDYEAGRQVEVLETGGSITQETRLFDTNSGHTRPLRSKEDAKDYRYFPDPNLSPLVLESAYVDEIRRTLPEMPDQKKHRYIDKMGLPAYDASVIVADKAVAEYFEAVANKCDPKLAANWITAELFGKLNKAGLSIEQSPVHHIKLAELIGLIERGVISGKIAKQVFEIMFETGESPAVIVERDGLVQVTDDSAIEKMVADVLAAHPTEVADYKAGKDKLLGFFVGQVMKVSAGKANPAAVNAALKRLLV
ncbi:MAG: Asp-tRNA(Asn)/Glu-tRNA(Gln) amidotransferase subunit GatB [Proteobacteria bacterium]|nr:Asp-tRNA(Asn)/Glu-tRNA(Gln) amidotransferase subunit GatB [Pseudomonadota bacterium]